jgi:hypothetical protein
VTVLAVTTRLADEPALGFGLLRDGFAISDFGFSDVGLDLEFTLQTVDDDFEMELAHTGDDRLTRLFVRKGAERGILLSELLKTQPELVEVGLGLRLDGDRDDGLGKRHALEDDRIFLLAESVARARVA